MHSYCSSRCIVAFKNSGYLTCVDRLIITLGYICDINAINHAYWIRFTISQEIGAMTETPWTITPGHNPPPPTFTPRTIMYMSLGYLPRGFRPRTQEISLPQGFHEANAEWNRWGTLASLDMMIVFHKQFLSQNSIGNRGAGIVYFNHGQRFISHLTRITYGDIPEMYI